MNISAPFIDRPVATTLLTIGLTLAGAVAFRLLPVSPLPRVDLPTISVSAALPGASPETMAATVAMPLERSLGRIAGRHRDDLDQRARLDAHRAAVRPRPRHQRRGARRAGGAQRGPQLAAAGPQRQSQLPQGQSGRRADHDPRAHVGHDDPGADVRRGVDHHRPEAVPAPRRGPGSGRRQLAARGARRDQSAGALQVRHRLRGRARSARGRPMPTGPRARWKTPGATGRSTPTIRRRRPPITCR